jgi:hypothetical protein
VGLILTLLLVINYQMINGEPKWVNNKDLEEENYEFGT